MYIQLEINIVLYHIVSYLCLCVCRLLDEKLRAPFARWRTGAVHYCQ